MSEPQSPPKLSLVEDAVEAEPTPPRRAGRGVLVWGLLVAALLFAWLYLNQLEQTNARDTRIAGLEADLAGARAELAVERARMGDVRGAIDRVAAELDVLRALASPAPSDAAEAPSEASPAAGRPLGLDGGGLLLPPEEPPGS